MAVTRRDFFKIGGLSIGAFGFARSLFSKSRAAAESKLENMVADVKPLTPEDYRMRLEKAKRLMAENSIDGLLLTGSTNLVYFTNVQWGRSERTFGGVLNQKGDPIWICPAFERKRAEERIPEGQEIRTWEEHENPFKLIAGIMNDLGARTGKLGLGPTIRSFVYHGLRKNAPSVQLVDGAVVTEECRGIKTEKEIAYMDLANKITKLAYREGFRNLREGMSRPDLGGIIRSAHQKMGVSGGGGPLFGPSSAFPHGTLTQRTLQEGDIILVDGGCSVEGYRADVTRTIVFGKPTEKQKKVWDVVRKAQVAAIKAVRPGVPCEEIDRAARKVVEDAGYGPEYKYFTHRVGHGIGMEGHEYPYLVRGNKLKLQPGMTFSDEPGVYIYGEFGVRIEDCFVVTEDGGRFLGGMESTTIDKPFGA
ncbi:MAG: Xaa-Pro peptidase family protein [Candidatus Aminicenantes bacterium]|nr:Xaa-Pro peptidase family protein [Candidatus Aminicenantes bacterium]